MDGQGTTWHRNIAENFNRVSTNVTDDRQTDRQTDRRQTDRQTTDGRTTTYSEPELEFTFAKKETIGQLPKLCVKIRPDS